ncbi:hypothetical protein [Agromyces humi]|uniref:hypothetical protein n=1 Tax=Agromyces humi TaxID=1766800 RepID=UPI001356C8FE|nr:hypothetical protein [Agromyces humi]
MGTFSETIVVRNDGQHPTAKNVWEAAVDRWHDERESRYASLRSYGFDVYPTQPAGHHVDLDHKPSEVGAIFPIANPEDVITTSRKFTVELTEPELASFLAKEWPADRAFWAKIDAQFPGQFIDPQTVRFTPPKQRKAVAKTTDGKLTTVYDLVETRENRYEAVVARDFESIAAAKAAGVDLMNASTYKTLEVRARITRDGNAALAVIARPVDKNRTVKVTGTVDVRTVKQNARIDEWECVLWYHH